MLCVVFWLLYMAIVPSGKISYVRRDFGISPPNYNYFISKLTPEDRVALTSEAKLPAGSLASWKITGDPVYFSLRTHRRFDKAKLTLKYKNEGDLPLIEAGILADSVVWRYDLRPIENKTIDQLSLAWDVISEGEAILLQREKKYNSIDEFLNNMPDNKEIALYNYNLAQKYLLPDYEKSNENLILDCALRGAYQFYVYIKDPASSGAGEDLDLDFVFQDLNKNNDADPIDINLYYDNQLIDSRHLDDDGITSPQPSNLPEGAHKVELRGYRELKFKTANLPEGAYKVELRVNNDIITKKISTAQSKLSFINKIWLADGCGENIILYTDSRKISAQTTNPVKLQTVLIQGKELEINETYKQFNITADENISEIRLAQDDVILAGDGVFSFSQNALISPGFKKINVDTDINKESINYVLANYSAPKESDGWKTASAEFDLSKAYREDNDFQIGTSGKYGFIISIPGLRADDEVEDWVEVGEIAVELEGRSLWEKLKQFFNNYK